MIAHFILLLIACLSSIACLLFRGLDDDVEADDSYIYHTQEFDQYQAADPSGKLSHTWLTVSSSTGYISSSVVYPASLVSLLDVTNPITCCPAVHI